MLQESVKPINFGTFEIENWEDYRKRLLIPEEGAIKEFYRQVVYDHFDDFNERFPTFNLEKYSFSFIQLSMEQIDEQVKSFRNTNKELKQWGSQYDEFESTNSQYFIFQYMSKHHKPPFPPVIIDTKNISNNGWREYGRPYHLIEGTHRISYLFRMTEKGIINRSCLFQFTLVSEVNHTQTKNKTQ